MRSNVTTALDLLRAADPARDVSPAESIEKVWAAVRADSAVGHAAPDVTPSDHTTTIEPQRPRRGQRVALAIGAAAMVAAVAGVSAAIVASRDASSHRPGGTSSIPDPSSVPSGDPNRAATVAAIEHALLHAPTLPGAVRAAGPPTASLASPSSTWGDTNVVDRVAFWTAPGTMQGAVDYLQAHPPAGTSPSGSGYEGNSKTGVISFRSIDFDAAPTSSTSRLELEYTVVAHDGGVALRLDARAIWVTTKPAAEHLGTVTSVDITLVRRAGAPPVHRTLTGPSSQRIADAVDALPILTARYSGCPADVGFTDRLVFHADGRSIVVTNRAQFCGGLAFAVDGQSQPELAGNVDSVVRAELAASPSHGS